MAKRLARTTITVRTSKELHKWLQAQAKKNRHSLNQECEARLRIDRDLADGEALIAELMRHLRTDIGGLLAEIRKAIACE